MTVGGTGRVSTSRLAIAGFLLQSLRVTLDVLLRGATNGERPRRDVLRDDRPGRSVRPVTDVNRGHEHRVDARLDAVADRRAGLRLLARVVVRGDVAGGDVAAGADVGVAYVGQVRDLRPLADV